MREDGRGDAIVSGTKREAETLCVSSLSSTTGCEQQEKKPANREGRAAVRAFGDLVPPTERTAAECTES